LSETDPQQAARLLRSSTHAVAFTGAGISTPSGIPDFRSAGSGLWERDDPMETASLLTFKRDPQRFYRWLQPLAEKIRAAQPNPAHLALAAMDGSLLKGVITQNIDGLHQRAGSNNVMELHGSVGSLTCLNCKNGYSASAFMDSFIDNFEIPLCPACSSVLKPDIILFGELLPELAWTDADEHARRADLMLVIGSSLNVFPAADLPASAVRRGTKLIIFNQTPTPLDRQAALVFRGDAAVSLEAVRSALN